MSSDSSSPSSSTPSQGGTDRSSILATLSSSQRDAHLEVEQSILPYVEAAESEAVRQMKLRALFRTIPSKDAAFTAFFVMMALTVITLIIPFITHIWVMLLVPLTTFLLMLAYLFRMHVIYDPERSSYNAMQFLLIVSPLVLAAALFSILGIVTNVYWIPVFFVITDILCLIIQTLGVRGILSSDRDHILNGLDYLIAGMGLALVANVLFLISILCYSKTIYATYAPILVTLLVIATILFIVRNVYRFHEFINARIRIKEDQMGTKNEKLFYAVDFVPIVGIVVILAIVQFVV